MKKKILLFMMMLFTGLYVFAQTKTDLNKAVNNTSTEIVNLFKKEKKKTFNIAVIVGETDSTKMADYLLGAFEVALKKGKNIRLIDRGNVTQKLKNYERDYQYSGFVNETSLVELGNELSIQYFLYVKFQQNGNENILDAKLLDIETNAAPVVKRFFVEDSDLVKNLTKDIQLKNRTLESYLEKIDELQNRKSDIEEKRDNDIIEKRSAINTDYADKIAKAEQKEYPPYYSDAEIKSKKNEEVKFLKEENARVVESETNKIRETYKGSVDACNSTKENYIRRMLAEKFVLTGASVSVTIGEFQRNANPKYFPISIKSNDTNVPFDESFKIELKNDQTLEQAYNKIMNAKKLNTSACTIEFYLRRISTTDEFFVVIKNIRVENSLTKEEIYSIDVDKNVKRVPGKTELTKDQEKSFKMDTESYVSWNDVNPASYYAPAPKNLNMLTFTSTDNNFISFKSEVYIRGDGDKLNSFVIGSREVTQQLYEWVMGINENSSSNKYWYSDWTGEKYYNRDSYGNNLTGNLPMENVTWYDAVAFCNEFTKKTMSASDVVYYSDSYFRYAYTASDAKSERRAYCKTDALGFRLPTGAEWSYAANSLNVGGEKTTYSGSNKYADVAWFYENSGNRTHDVATKKPNKAGLYDMSGNVAEWVNDTNYHSYNDNWYAVARGGDYSEYGSSGSINTTKEEISADYHSGKIGFRICRNAK